jgi:hypothetical protein
MTLPTSIIGKNDTIKKQKSRRFDDNTVDLPYLVPVQVCRLLVVVVVVVRSDDCRFDREVPGDRCVGLQLPDLPDDQHREGCSPPT